MHENMAGKGQKSADVRQSKGGKKTGKRDVGLNKRLTGGDEERNSSNKGGKRKSNNGASVREGYVGAEGSSPKMSHKSTKAPESLKAQGLQAAPAFTLRKRVDPETANYFYNIANLFESNELDLEERPVVCGNALEETRGKELELATDVVISRTLQTLLEGCDLDPLCGFLLGSAKVFSHMATDRCGSHVAETALKSLAVHAQDPEARSTIEDVLRKICEAVVVDAVYVMSNRYGSHVLRSLICLCKGVPVDTMEEYHGTKSSSVLAERLNFKFLQSSRGDPYQFQHGFPNTFKFLVVELVGHSKDDIVPLCLNKYSSFVMQVALKLLVGDNHGLLHVILIIIGCPKQTSSEDYFIDATKVQGILELLEDTASSHLLEVIMEVAPEDLYDEILNKVFRGSLPNISMHHCGNFVVQALLSSAKSQGQVDLMWDELHPQFKHLLEMGKSGVITSLLAACHRLQTRGCECCKMLADALCSGSEFPRFIVPRLLFLESYFSCKDKSNWRWPLGEKMHTLGCLMLQTIFKYPKKFIQPYIRSILSMDTDLILQTARDTGGGRVLESFLCSDSSSKQKQKTIVKLQDHFGELSMHPSGSFTVEKCFDASDLSLKETIGSELAAVRAEIFKTKHGPYIIKKLDIDGLEARPEQWKKRQATKEMARREFYTTFGSCSIHEDRNTHTPSKKKSKRRKKNSQEVDLEHGLSASLSSEFPDIETSVAKLGFPGLKQRQGHKRKRETGATEAAESSSKRSVKNSGCSSLDRQSGKGTSLATNLADLASKRQLSAGEVQFLFQGTMKAAKKKMEGRQPLAEKIPFLRRQKR